MLLNTNHVRVFFLQSAAKDLHLFLFKGIMQMLRCARHDRIDFFTPSERLPKLNERTGNVYENKGSVWKTSQGSLNVTENKDLTLVIRSEDFMTLRLTTVHENALRAVPKAPWSAAA